MFKRRNFLTILGIIGLFFFCARMPAAAGDMVTRQELLLSVPTPVQKVALVSVVRLVAEDAVVGAVELYDDPGTERPVDFLELFNGAGDLLAFAWFDRFGIARTAVDRGFLQTSHQPEGIFVILAEGQPI